MKDNIHSLTQILQQTSPDRQPHINDGLKRLHIERLFHLINLAGSTLIQTTKSSVDTKRK